MSLAFHSSRRASTAAGQPISQLMSRALENPDLISLAAGFVDGATLPQDAVQQAIAALFEDTRSGSAALQYGSTPGFHALREILRQRMLQADGQHEGVALDQIVITAGSNQLLHLVSESLLEPGDIVLCASPTYLVYLGLLAGLEARAVGVASDAQGMIPEALDEQFRQIDSAGNLGRVKAIYLVPYFDNPAGATMPLDRRVAVVETAKRWSRLAPIHVISDEAYRELRYGGDDIPSPRVCDDSGDTVIVAGTFSKSFSPGIRVGWGVLPRHLVQPVCDLKGNVDFGSPNFNQHLMAKVLEQNLYEPHLARLRESYRSKLTAMLDAANEFLTPLEGVRWYCPSGGLYVWLQLPEQIDAGLDGRLFQMSIREGVLYVPGEYCYPAEGQPLRRNMIRLSFGVQSCEKIREGVEKLARAIAAAAW
jgi:2-aminoadipate transaminase